MLFCLITMLEGNIIWYRDLYFWRQSLVILAGSSYSVGTGFMLSFPLLLNPAILSPNNSDIRVTHTQASSIAGCQGLAGAVGFCLLPFFMESLGRKTINIGINALVGIGFLIFAFANNIPALYTGRIIQGLAICGVYATSKIITEYSDAKRRVYFIALKKASVTFGSLMCHSIGMYWTWRQVAGFAIIPNIIAIIMTLFWKESPSYLAMRGRFDECEKSYQWLHGDGPERKKKLENNISTQLKRRLHNKTKLFKMTIRKIFRKDYLILFVVICLLMLIIDCCGRYYMLDYIGKILTETTNILQLTIF